MKRIFISLLILCSCSTYQRSDSDDFDYECKIEKDIIHVRTQFLEDDLSIQLWCNIDSKKCTVTTVNLGKTSRKNPKIKKFIAAKIEAFGSSATIIQKSPGLNKGSSRITYIIDKHRETFTRKTQGMASDLVLPASASHGYCI